MTAIVSELCVNSNEPFNSPLRTVKLPPTTVLILDSRSANIFAAVADALLVISHTCTEPEPTVTLTV